jgi:hypothetical protein
MAYEAMFTTNPKAVTSYKGSLLAIEQVIGISFVRSELPTSPRKQRKTSRERRKKNPKLGQMTS